jgi:hypothetical protein
MKTLDAHLHFVTSLGEHGFHSVPISFKLIEQKPVAC